MSERGIIWLAADLDGTLFHSRWDRQPEDLVVDSYEETPCAYLSPHLLDMLDTLPSDVRVVPVTTRSLRQYRRIQWPDGREPALIVASNGGSLLRSGEVDHAWSRTAFQIAVSHVGEMRMLVDWLRAQDAVQSSSMVDSLFVAATCDTPEDAVRLRRALPPTELMSTAVGRKLYLMPPGLDKGAALRRLKKVPETQGARLWIAAGDSVLDLPMLQEADVAVVPEDLADLLGPGVEIVTVPDKASLGEEALRTAARLAAEPDGTI